MHRKIMEPQSNVYGGSEDEMLAAERFDEERELEKPLAAWHKVMNLDRFDLM